MRCLDRVLFVLVALSLAAWSTDVRAQGSLHFDGQDDVVNVGSAEVLKTPELTVEAWINPQNYPSYATILTNTSTSSWNDGYGLAHYNQNDDINFFVDSWDDHYVSGTLNGTGAWTHVAGTYDGQQLILYIDGQPVDTADYDGGIAYGSSGLQLGLGQGGYPWEGYVAEVRIWDHARNAQQIESAWMRRLTGTEPGLMGYWPMSEGQGTTAEDATNNDNAGTIDGPTWSQQAPPFGGASDDYALRLDGDESWVDIPNSDLINLEGVDRRTIEAWFMVDDVSLAERKQVIYQEGGQEDGFNLYVHDGTLYAGAWSEEQSFSGAWIETSSVQSGRWHHVALVYDKTHDAFSAYLDGAAFGTDSAPATIERHEAGVAIGGVLNDTKFHDGDFTGSGAELAGQVDEVNLWDIPRTSAEVASDLGRTFSGTETGLIAYYRFDEGSGDTAVDATGNGLDGSIQNATWVQPGAPIGGSTRLAIGDGAACTSDEINFSWNDLAGASAHRLDVATARNASSIVDQVELGDRSSFGYDARTLQDGQTYFGRIAASNDDGTTYFRTSNFTDGITVDLRAPRPNRPVGSLIDDGPKVRFTFTGADNTGIESFHVQLAADETFSDILAEQDVEPDEALTYNGEIGETYFARASAVDCAGNRSEYSPVSVGVRVPHQPDLQVTRIEGPGEAFSGQEIEVRWEVENAGMEATDAGRWRDAVILSEDDELGGSDDVVLKTIDNVSYLSAGESYSSRADIDLPRGISGDRYLFISADQRNNVGESNEANNASSASHLPVTLSPYADLQVADVVVPDNAFSGDSLVVQWTIENAGSGRTDVDEWYDAIFFSSDSAFDYSLEGIAHGNYQILEQALAEKKHTGALAAGASYATSMKVALPTDASGGTFHIFVAADIGSSFRVTNPTRREAVYEFNKEFNNWTSDSTDITLTPPPDLIVTDVSGPVEVTSGDRVELAWTVENAGAGPSRSGTWRDLAYFSLSSTFDSTARAIGGLEHSGDLETGESYSSSGTMQIPEGMEGTGFFHVRTDLKDDVFEHDFEDNNVGSASTGTQVTRAPYPNIEISSARVTPGQVNPGERVVLEYDERNTGDLDAPERTDSVYISTSDSWNPGGARSFAAISREPLAQGDNRTASFGLALPVDAADSTYYLYVRADARDDFFEYPEDAANLVRTGPVEIRSHPPVDLRVSVSAPPEASSGDSLRVTYTVENRGEGRTLTESWEEAIYLSADRSLDPNEDDLLIRRSRSAPLRGNESYEKTVSVPIPGGASGDYYLLAQVDRRENVQEADERNNVTATAIRASLPTPSNLLVGSVHAPASRNAGQPLRIAWTVENTADGVTGGSTWFDAVYLSRDPALDREDVLLGTRPHEGALQPGSTYSDSLDVKVPPYAAGAYYLLVETDRRDDIYEHQGESDNVETSPIEITLPSPSDLRVSEISVPASAEPGAELTATWTIENTSSEPSSGAMREGVFVSSDEAWDVEDALVGVVERDIDLAPGATGKVSMKADLSTTFRVNQQGQITEELPGVKPGSYFVIVRTDIANNIRETDNENNVGVSAATLEVDVPLLTYTSAETLSISNGQGRYYRLEADAGKDLRITLDGDENGPSHELYVAFNRPPQAGGDYDFAANEPLETDQQVIVPSAQAGTYYLLAVARGDGGAIATVSADELGYSLTEVSPSVGGQGQVTTVLRGAGFREDATPLLVGNDMEFEGSIVRFTNTTEMDVRWQLSDVGLGTYDVVVERADGSRTTLSDGFEVEETSDDAVEIAETSPAAIRAGGDATFIYTYENTSNVDIPYLQSVVQVTGHREVIVQTSPGLTEEAEFISREIDQRVDDHYYLMSDETTLIPVLGKDIRPGQTVRATITFTDVDPGPFSYRLRNFAFTEEEYVRTHSEIIERWRQIVRNAPGDFESETVALASDKEAFLEQFMEEYAATGRLDSTDLDLVGAVSTTGKKRGASRGMPDVAGDDVMRIAEVDRYLAQQDTTSPTPPDTICLFGGTAAVCTGDCDTFEDQVNECKDRNPSLPPGLPDILTSITTINQKRCIQAAAPAFTNIGGHYGEDQCNCKQVANACDPNDIVGPGGFGDENWIRRDQLLPYKIRFENDPERASAPAQVVDIRHPLDADVDARTFRLGSFGFANMTFEAPENAAHYSARLDVQDSLGVLVDVTAGLDVVRREAFWVFTTIDPETGSQPTSDPLAGFLPVNDSTGVGEGFVEYTVEPTAGASTGDPVEAKAAIVFDINAPIETPVVVNTIDASPPVSRLEKIPSRTDTTAFKLRWSGEDEGAGVRSFDLYVATSDDGPFQPYETDVEDTSTLFVGEQNREYRFFTLATDYAGNTEPMKSSGTGVSIPDEDRGREVPDSYALHANYPNPFNPSTTIPYDLPEPGSVTITVYNVLGREVRTYRPGTRRSGHHEHRLDLSDLASGVYFYELRVLGGRESDEVRFRDTGKMVLVK